jgi:3-deoxy-7-phosphoheptulonate synthase
MIVVMKQGAEQSQIDRVVKLIREMGLKDHVIVGTERTVVAVIGDDRYKDRPALESVEGVERVVPILAPYKLASKDMHEGKTLVPLNGMKIGGTQLALIAGPCSVESREQILEAADVVKAAGATALRGGAYKPRTSPYSFQGLGLAGLELLAEARTRTKLPVVTEVMSTDQVAMVAQYADVLQIGARNMQNYNLLRAVGETNRPILLKRGMMSTLEELLMSAEYVLAAGNPNVILCERGIRTFETYTRNTFDINAVPALKARTHLPVMVDPSHATGHWQYVGAAALAGIAAGADGLIIEVHPHPEKALSDGSQSLKPDVFNKLVTQMRAVAEAVGRTI